jgi:7-cyano-7-deazaguanine synthase
MEEKEEKPLAVVLLSGGLDSATVLAIAGDEGYECCCLSFAYGQRQSVELERARSLVARSGVARHLVLRLDLDAIGGSALTTKMAVPKGRSLAAMATDAIPVTYVPGRNTIFLSYAVAWAEVLGAGHIFIGVNVMDYSGYPDCRPAFLRAFEEMANLGTRAGVVEGRRFRIQAPLLKLSKKEIIRKGMALGVDYSLTHSCYDPDVQGRACGECDSCRLRLKGFAEAGFVDPVEYQRTGQSAEWREE